MPTYPIIALEDGDTLSPEWVEDITDAANEHNDRLTAVETETFVGETVASAGSGNSASSTKIVHLTKTFTADGTSRYWVIYTGAYQGSVVGAPVGVSLHWEAGPTVAGTDTELRVMTYHVGVAGTNVPITITKSWIPTSGEVTIGVFLNRPFGSGNVSLDGGTGSVEATLEVFRR